MHELRKHRKWSGGQPGRNLLKPLAFVERRSRLQYPNSFESRGIFLAGDRSL